MSKRYEKAVQFLLLLFFVWKGIKVLQTFFSRPSAEYAHLLSLAFVGIAAWLFWRSNVEDDSPKEQLPKTGARRLLEAGAFLYAARDLYPTIRSFVERYTHQHTFLYTLGAMLLGALALWVLCSLSMEFVPPQREGMHDRTPEYFKSIPKSLPEITQ